MAELITVESYIIIDSNGDYTVGVTPEAARELYEQEVQSFGDCNGFRMIRIEIKAAVPEVVELAGEVNGESAGEAAVLVEARQVPAAG